MLDSLKGLGDLPKLLAKAGEMRGRMGEVQERLKDELGRLRSTADSGGGMVTAVCNGRLELVSVKIDPTRLNPATAKPEDLELLEDLIVAAVAAAQDKAGREATEVTQREMAKAAEGLGLPPDLMAKLGG